MLNYDAHAKLLSSINPSKIFEQLTSINSTTIFQIFHSKVKNMCRLTEISNFIELVLELMRHENINDVSKNEDCCYFRDQTKPELALIRSFSIKLASKMVRMLKIRLPFFGFSSL